MFKLLLLVETGRMPTFCWEDTHPKADSEKQRNRTRNRESEWNMFQLCLELLCNLKGERVKVVAFVNRNDNDDAQ